MNLTQFLVAFGAALVGSGLGTTIVGALFKRVFDAQIETHKALLQRSGRIHEKQAEALIIIHSKLEHALYHLRRVASAGKFEGEASDEELLRRMSEDLGAASEEFSKNRLLIGETLSHKLDEFFHAIFLTGADFSLVLRGGFQDAQQRANLWNKAGEKAHKEIPGLLDAIRVEARAVIHS